MQRVNLKAVITIIVIVTVLGSIWAFRTGTTTEKDLSELSRDDRAMMIRARTAQAASMVQIVSPTENARIAQPLKVTGIAVDEWYASDKTFSIELHDQNGAVIGTAIAKSSGNEVNGFVPFSAIITYTHPTSQTVGKLVLKKSNPSADPEKDLEYAYPISF